MFGTAKFMNRFWALSIYYIPLLDSCVLFFPSVKCLGVVLDSKLNWEEHVLKMVEKANTIMYQLDYFRRSTTLKLRQHLVQSLLFPVIDYCSLVYCDISRKRDQVIQRVLNTGVRYVFQVRWSLHITSYQRQFCWLTNTGHRKYFAASEIYKIFATGFPACLANFFLSTTALVR